MTAFEQHFRFGQHGEHVVAKWLGLRGYYVTPTSMIVERQLRSPSLVNRHDGSRSVLPDFMASRSGASKWVEVKTKTKDAFHNKTQEHRQGISSRHFDDYLFVQRESGIPGYLAFLVLTPPPPKLRIAPLDELDQNRRFGAIQGEPHFFWPIDLFENHEIVDEDLVLIAPAPQPVGVKHIWEKPAPKTVEQQGYFNFPDDGWWTAK